MEKIEIKTFINFFLTLSVFIAFMFFINSIEFEIKPLQVLLAQLFAGILKGLGYKILLTENTIVVFHNKILMQFEISRDSTGWKGLFLFSSLILSTPAVASNKKIKHLAIFLPIIFLVNIVRIITTILIGLNFGLSAFNFWHSFLWSYLFLGFVFTLWSLWVFLTYTKKI
jgi:exosortase/archaeosortase family protein